jgi:hypothetical protein
MFDMVFSDGIKRGMAFDGYPYHRANGVFMTRGGSMISKRDWKKLKKRLARDEELGPKHDLVRQKDMRERGESFDEEDERGEEAGVEALRRYLTEHTGLSAESIEAACWLAAKERGEVADALPIAGPKHAALPRGGNSTIKATREPNEKVFKIGEDHAASFARRYPDAVKVEIGVGYSQFDPPIERRTDRSPRLALDAASAKAGKRLRKKLGLDKHFGKIGVGEWLPRVR